MTRQVARLADAGALLEPARPDADVRQGAASQALARRHAGAAQDVVEILTAELRKNDLQ